jgi:hypothetical protein
MRYLFPAGILLALVLAINAPSTASAYSEWLAISTKVTALATDKELPLRCDLQSGVGNIYFRGNTCDFRKLMRFMVELGHFLDETTNAGPNYLLRVHFADRVRSISVSELKRLQFGNKTSRAEDPMLLYDFFSRFETR